MKKKYTTGDSQTDWNRINSIKDEAIDLSEIPEITEEQMAHAQLRIGGRPLSREKVRINIMLDAQIIAYFKAKAGGRGYQTLINDALNDMILHRDLETMIRRIVREELQKAN